MVGRIAQHSAAREALACGKEKPELQWRAERLSKMENDEKSSKTRRIEQKSASRGLIATAKVCRGGRRSANIAAPSGSGPARNCSWKGILSVQRKVQMRLRKMLAWDGTQNPLELGQRVIAPFVSALQGGPSLRHGLMRVGVSRRRVYRDLREGGS